MVPVDELLALADRLEDEIVDLEADVVARITARIAAAGVELEDTLTRTWRRVVGDLAAPITAPQADELAAICRVRARPILARLRDDVGEILDDARTRAVATGTAHAGELLAAVDVELEEPTP